MIDISNEIPINIKYEMVALFQVIEYRDTVYREFGITVEVRSREEGHNTPHVHAHYQQYHVSIDINSAIIIIGNLPNKQLEKAIEFVQNNRTMLLEKWNKYHEFKFKF